MPAGAVALLGSGEDAFLVDLGCEDAPDRAARTWAAAERLRAALPGAEVVIGAGTVLVEGASQDAIRAALEGGAPLPASALREGREHVLPAVYDGPDLAGAAAALGLSIEALIEIHASTTYAVELLGFLPGFAYLGPLDPRLVLPRRPSPRPVVPAGSLAIAAGFTGVYPFASPGGWTLIGRMVGPPLFDPDRDPPGLFAPGDRVRFTPVDAREAPEEQRAPSPRASRATGRGLRVVAARAAVTVQDRGRIGWKARGLPPSGALSPALLAEANAAVGNDDGAAALEVPLGSLEVQASGALVVSIDGEPARSLRDGETLVVPPSPRAVRYLAVRGGIDVPLRLGARATLPVAKLGGLDGRALRRGDFVPVGDRDDARREHASRRTHDAQTLLLTVDPGPYPNRFPPGALSRLCEEEFEVSSVGDRVGVRLSGPKIPRDQPDLALPAPARRGAIQVTTEGVPIVLGPDHPTTGGYPVLAVLRREAQSHFALLRPGDRLRFCPGESGDRPFTK
ncbi:MAG: carboxyltransferase domain-containing protein [Byssovorax sp.]